MPRGWQSAISNTTWLKICPANYVATALTGISPSKIIKEGAREICSRWRIETRESMEDTVTVGIDKSQG